MPYENAIELVDRDYGLLSSPRNLRSIRLKEDSFFSVSRAWNKIRAFVTGKSVKDIEIEDTENKLQKAQEEFKNLEYEPRDFNRVDGQVSRAERGIMEKAKVIARLEERLNILRDVPVSPKFVNDRAIKLKDNMMNNTRFNSRSAYSVPEEFKDAIVASPIGVAPLDYDIVNPVDKIMENETKETSKSVQEIMNETDKNVRDDIVVVPDRSEVKKTVDNEFSKQEEEYLKNQDLEVSDSPLQISKEEVEEVVNSDEVRAAVDEAINGINISRNGAFGAKIEKYEEPEEKVIPESEMNGNYSLTKDDNDEDFRKTEISSKNDVSAIESIKAKIPQIDISQAFHKVDNDENESTQPIENVVEDSVDIEDKNESKDGSVHFDYDENSISALTEAVDNAGSMSEIQALIARVKELKELQNTTKAAAEEARKKAMESDKMKADAEAKLRDYANALAEDSKYNEDSATQAMEQARNNEALIEAMLSMIQPTDSLEKGRAK